jgi:DNA-binding transcriptional ArsR family regulator
MPNQKPAIELTLHALADSTRKKVVERLSRGSATVTELARPFDLAMPSFLQHLRVLEICGLVRSRKDGRVRTCHLEPKTLKILENWLVEQREMWESRLVPAGKFIVDGRKRKKDLVDP